MTIKNYNKNVLSSLSYSNGYSLRHDRDCGVGWQKGKENGVVINFIKIGKIEKSLEKRKRSLKSDLNSGIDCVQGRVEIKFHNTLNTPILKQLS